MPKFGMMVHRYAAVRGARCLAPGPTVVALVVLLAGMAAACEPELIVGRWACSSDDMADPEADKMAPIALPWATGFEDGFCDYTALAGFCYSALNASYEVVTSPVHSGRYAAAFHVTSSKPASHARCVRQGELPKEAYYGAWYYVPAPATNTATWNLFHFQAQGFPRSLWDVSLVNARGELRLAIYDFFGNTTRVPPNSPPIPIGEWFHVQFYLKRAADPTGTIELYQNGRKIFELTNVITDDTQWGQWYVGNYADGLMPADSTLYVDDVTIRATL